MKKVLISLGLVFGFVFSGVAWAAPATIYSTDEVTGAGATSRADTEALQKTWKTDVITNLGAAATDFEVGSISNATLPNVLAASNGVNVTVSLNDMTNFANTSDLGVSASTQGSAGNATSTTMQDSSPKPSSLYNTGTSAYYNETSGSGSSKNGLVFTFSKPTSNFGAWFGDVETRTDGNGTPAEIRLYDATGAFMSSQVIEPMPSDPAFNQAQCGAPVQDSFRGCGNRASRWIGFVADPADLVSRMVVIVGDDDSTSGSDDGETEHLSFLGATMAVVDESEVKEMTEEVKGSCSQGNADLNDDFWNMTEIVVSIDGVNYPYVLPGGPREYVSQIDFENALAAAVLSAEISEYAYIVPGSVEMSESTIHYEFNMEGSSRLQITINGNVDNNQDFDSCIILKPIPPSPQIGVSKALTGLTAQSVDGLNTGINSVTYSITVTNTGNVDLSNVSLLDDLAATFGHPGTTTISNPAVNIITAPNDTSSSISTNAAYGIGDWETIAPGGILVMGDSFTLEISVNVDAGNETGPFYNTAIAAGQYGEGEELIEVEDESQDGNEYSPDEDDDPTNNNDPTQVSFVLGSAVNPPPIEEEEEENKEIEEETTEEELAETAGEDTLAETGIYSGIATTSGLLIMLLTLLPYVALQRNNNS